MLVIPLHRRPGWAGLPWATLALIAANVLVFFLLQAGDEAAWREAQRYYQSSGLAEVEAPAVVAHLRASGRNELASQLEAEPAATRGDWQLALTRREPLLAAAVADGRLLALDHPEHAWWLERRARLQEMYDGLFSTRYSLRYDAPPGITLLTSAFLHGDFEHLAGNMLFLLLVGMLVEGALGAGLYLGLYALAALGAGAVSLLVNYGQPSGALGASGAIAGLMGAFCVLWGLRRVRVFYWLFVVFGHARVVALWLLPFWLGWELWQWAGDERGVAFDAHAGGLIAGALCAYAVRAAGWQREDYLDHEVVQDREAELRDAARAALGRLEFATARAAVAGLLELAPDDPAAQELRYRAHRDVADDGFHDAARRLLLAPRQQGRAAAAHVALFDDYLVASRQRPRLSADELLALARRWIAAGEAVAGERLLTRMADRAPTLAGLPEAWFDLWLSLRERRPADAARVREAILQRFPSSLQAAKLRAAP
jgi:membrane associated rhomboid family serine protease